MFEMPEADSDIMYSVLRIRSHRVYAMHVLLSVRIAFSSPYLLYVMAMQ